MRDARSNQIRAVGLLAYGRDGSRVRVENGGTAPARCLGYYGSAPVAGTQMRLLTCGGIGREFTFTRVTIP